MSFNLKNYFPGKLPITGDPFALSKYFDILNKKRKPLIIALVVSIIAILNMYFFFITSSSEKRDTLLNQNNVYSSKSAEHYNFAVKTDRSVRSPFDITHPDNAGPAKEIQPVQNEKVSIKENAPVLTSKNTENKKAASPKLVGILSDKNVYTAIVTNNNEYRTVSAGDNIFSYSVISIDKNSIQLQDGSGQLITCYLKGF